MGLATLGATGAVTVGRDGVLRGGDLADRELSAGCGSIGVSVVPGIVPSDVPGVVPSVVPGGVNVIPVVGIGPIASGVLVGIFPGQGAETTYGGQGIFLSFGGDLAVGADLPHPVEYQLHGEARDRQGRA